MKPLAFLLLVCLTWGLLATEPPPATAGCGYYTSYHAGYEYWGGGYYRGTYYARGYYQPTYYHQPTYYPTYSVSYNPDSAKQLEIIDKAMGVLAKMAQGQAPVSGGKQPVVGNAQLRDGQAIVTARCAGCHAADKVEAKGSKLVLLTPTGTVADLSLKERRSVVERTFSSDSAKQMPPGRPLPREERAALADFLGVQVVETGN